VLVYFPNLSLIQRGLSWPKDALAARFKKSSSVSVFPKDLKVFLILEVVFGT